MKKIISLTIAFILTAASISVCAYDVTIYAPDGRTAVVQGYEVAAYQHVGWYTSPVATMYAPDGRTAVVYDYEVSAWQNVGWYTSPVATMYAPDGRTAVVYDYEVSAWQNVGWYTSPVATMYAPDGRTAVVYDYEVKAWQNVGWSTVPFTNYKSAYAKVLKDVIASGDYSKQDSYFSLINIDNDGIPELTYSIASDHVHGAYLYTFYNGDAVKLTHIGYDSMIFDTFGEFGSLAYKEFQGLFLSNYMGMGAYMENVYKLENGKAVSLCRFSACPGMSLDYEYSVDNQAVSYSEYVSKKKQYGFTDGEYCSGYSDSYYATKYKLNLYNIENVLGA